MTPELRIEPVWHDQDMVEARVTATNGTFAGAVCIYIGLDALPSAADQLSGFPSRPGDRRRIEWGRPGMGAASLDFVAAEGLGECHVVVHLRTGDQCFDQAGQAVTILIPFEPAALDRFVLDLRRSSSRRHEVAVLTGVP